MTRRKGQPVLAPGATGFGAIAQQYLASRMAEHKLTEKSRARITHIINRKLAWLHHVPVARINANEVELLLKGRMQKAAVDTVQKEFEQLERILVYAIRADLIDTSKVLMLKLPQGDAPKERISLERDEFEAILAVCNEKYQAVFTLLAYTGMRKGEAQALIYDMVNGVAINLSADTTKSSVARRILLHPKAIAAIETLRAYSDGTYVMPQTGSGATWYLYIGRKAAGAGIEKKIGIHTLRHTAATWFANTNGVPLQSVRSILGHKSLEMTSRYVHTDATADDDAMALLD